MTKVEEEIRRRKGEEGSIRECTAQLQFVINFPLHITVTDLPKIILNTFLIDYKIYCYCNSNTTEMDNCQVMFTFNISNITQVCQEYYICIKLNFFMSKNILASYYNVT
jgi:hypothetical protein